MKKITEEQKERRKEWKQLYAQFKELREKLKSYQDACKHPEFTSDYKSGLGICDLCGEYPVRR